MRVPEPSGIVVSPGSFFCVGDVGETSAREYLQEGRVHKLF